jgi:hypothetical protein
MYYGVAALVEKDEMRWWFGDEAENSPISDIWLEQQYNHARSIIRQQVLITQQVPAKEPAVIEDITLEELLRLKMSTRSTLDEMRANRTVTLTST